MPKFSNASLAKLATIHPDLQKLFLEVVKVVDCIIVCGYRDKEEQDKAYAMGRSLVRFPNSKHNINPSNAVDVVPYPIDWLDIRRFYYFGGFVVATALKLNISIRWGGDWNGDFQVKDQNFNDLPHFELRWKN